MTTTINTQYIASDHPEWKLIHDHLPPAGVKLLFRGLYTGVVVSVYHPDYGFVAWMELPKYPAEIRRRLDSLVAAGIDPTKHASP